MGGWRPTQSECDIELNASKLSLEARSKWRHEAVRKYAGPAYEGWQDGGESDPENTGFGHVAQMIPAMVSGTPQCRLTTMRGQETQSKALALQAAGNRGMREQRVERPLERVAVDMLFTWGVGKIIRSARPGQEGKADPLNMPAFRYVPPRWFAHDPHAIDPDLWAWSGDARVSYLADLVDEGERDETSGWNVRLLKEITPKPLPVEFRAGEGRGRSAQTATLDRGEVAVWELWVRDWEWTDDELDEWEKTLKVRPTRSNGYNGALITLLDETTAHYSENQDHDSPDSWVRAPRPFYGPRWGPHIAFGAYVVPDEADPLGLIAATASQSAELNEHARSASNSMRVYKRGIVFDNDEAVDQFQMMGHDNVGSAPAANFREGEGFLAFEIGGVTEQQLAHLAILHERYDRNAGTDDSSRGRADAQATATAVATAAGRSATRSGWVLTKFAAGVSEMFRSYLWYLWHDDSMMVALDERAVQEMGMADEEGSGWFFGGDNPAATAARLTAAGASPDLIQQIEAGIKDAPQDDPIGGGAFDDLEIVIELASMREGSPEMQQFETMQMQGAIQESAMVSQMPWIDPVLWAKMKARTLGMPEFAQIVNPKKMADAQQLFMEALERGGEEAGDRSGVKRTGARETPFRGKGDQFLGSAVPAMGNTHGRGNAGGKGGAGRSAGGTGPRAAGSGASGVPAMGATG